MDHDSTQALRQLLQSRRTGALGTLRDGAPFVSMVPFALAGDGTAFYFLISRLAQHTQDVLRDPQASLMVMAGESEDTDPTSLGRVSIQGAVEELERGSAEAQRASEAYFARFPQSEGLLSLGDFSFFALRPRGARFVAGFARAFSLAGVDLPRILSAPAGA